MKKKQNLCISNVWIYNWNIPKSRPAKRCGMHRACLCVYVCLSNLNAKTTTKNSDTFYMFDVPLHSHISSSAIQINHFNSDIEWISFFCFFFFFSLILVMQTGNYYSFIHEINANKCTGYICLLNEAEITSNWW